MSFGYSYPDKSEAYFAYVMQPSCQRWRGLAALVEQKGADHLNSSTKSRRKTRGPAEDPWPLLARPGFLARRFHQIHVSLFNEICAEFGVTPLQYSLLSALSQHGDCDQTTLAHRVALDRTTTTGALKRLESQGLIQRMAGEPDRRSQNCRITAAGEAMCARMAEPVRRAHDLTVAALDPAEQATLMGLLERIIRHRDETAPKPPQLPKG